MSGFSHILCALPSLIWIGWLGLLFCPFKSDACEPIQIPSLEFKATSTFQRSESVEVKCLQFGISLIEEVFFAGSHPTSSAIGRENPKTPARKAIYLYTGGENLALDIGEMQRCFQSLALIRDHFISGSLLFIQVAPLGEKVIEQKNDEPANDSRSNMRENKYRIFTHVLSGICGALAFLLGKRLMAPNVLLSVTQFRTNRKERNRWLEVVSAWSQSVRARESRPKSSFAPVMPVGKSATQRRPHRVLAYHGRGCVRVLRTRAQGLYHWKTPDEETGKGDHETGNDPRYDFRTLGWRQHKRALGSIVLNSSIRSLVLPHDSTKAVTPTSARVTPEIVSPASVPRGSVASTKATPIAQLRLSCRCA